MNLNTLKKRCAHCNAPTLQYCGWTLSNFHKYYKCSTCLKYTEYYYPPLRTFITVGVFMLLFCGAFNLLLGTNSNSPNERIFYFIAFVVLFTLLSYKLRWAFLKIIPIDKLPNDGSVLQAPNKIFCFLLTALFVVGLLIYASVFLFNLIHQ